MDKKKIIYRIIIGIIFILLFGTGFLFGRGCSQARIDDAIRLAEQERELAQGLSVNISGMENYNRQLREYIVQIEGYNKQSEEDNRKLRIENERFKERLDYSAELDRLTRESLERLAKEFYGK